MVGAATVGICSLGSSILLFPFGSCLLFPFPCLFCPPEALLSCFQELGTVATMGNPPSCSPSPPPVVGCNCGKYPSNHQSHHSSGSYSCFSPPSLFCLLGLSVSASVTFSGAGNHHNCGKSTQLLTWSSHLPIGPDHC